MCWELGTRGSWSHISLHSVFLQRTLQASRGSHFWWRSARLGLLWGWDLGAGVAALTAVGIRQTAQDCGVSQGFVPVTQPAGNETTDRELLPGVSVIEQTPLKHHTVAWNLLGWQISFILTPFQHEKRGVN